MHIRVVRIVIAAIAVVAVVLLAVFGIRAITGNKTPEPDVSIIDAPTLSPLPDIPTPTPEISPTDDEDVAQVIVLDPVDTATPTPAAVSPSPAASAKASAKQTETESPFIDLTIAKTTIATDETINVSVTVYNSTTLAQKKPTMTSSNPSVASITVQQSGSSYYGQIKGLAAGTTLITCTLSGAESSSFTLTVTQSTVALTGMTLTLSSTTVSVGGTASLVVTPIPANASLAGLTFASSDPNIATVSSTGIVTGKLVGRVTMFATSTNNITAHCFVDVVLGPSPTPTPAAFVGIKASVSASNIPIGGYSQITILPNPSNSVLPSMAYNYVSADGSIASVSSSGMIQGRAVGTTTITIISADFKYNTAVTITVYDSTPTPSVAAATPTPSPAEVP